MNRDAGAPDGWKAWAAATGYVLVACVLLVLPMADRFASVLLWTEFFPHDSVLNAGILERGRRAIPSPALRVFEWTGEFPLHNSLAATENLLGWQLFYMPLRWAGASVACAYNSLLIASLVLSAIGASLLARRLGIRGEGAFLAGLIFAFVPFHLNHLLHLQTMAVCWAPFALFALDRFLDKGKRVDLVGVVRGQQWLGCLGIRWSTTNEVGDGVSRMQLAEQ